MEGVEDGGRRGWRDERLEGRAEIGGGGEGDGGTRGEGM